MNRIVLVSRNQVCASVLVYVSRAHVTANASIYENRHRGEKSAPFPVKDRKPGHEVHGNIGNTVPVVVAEKQLNSGGISPPVSAGAAV